jgi:hypothetical protein
MMQMQLQQSIGYTAALVNWSLGGHVWVTVVLAIAAAVNTAALVVLAVRSTRR